MIILPNEQKSFSAKNKAVMDPCNFWMITQRLNFSKKGCVPYFKYFRKNEIEIFLFLKCLKGFLKVVKQFSYFMFWTFTEAKTANPTSNWYFKTGIVLFCSALIFGFGPPYRHAGSRHTSDLNLKINYSSYSRTDWIKRDFKKHRETFHNFTICGSPSYSLLLWISGSMMSMMSRSMRMRPQPQKAQKVVTHARDSRLLSHQ